MPGVACKRHSVGVFLATACVRVRERIDVSACQLAFRMADLPPFR
jgi:hypothetical protein